MYKDVRVDDSRAKVVKNGHCLLGRESLTVADDISKAYSADSFYGKDKIKGLVGMTFAQVIASQAVGAVMGDINAKNVFAADNGKPCTIFDQRARGDKESSFRRTHGVSFPSPALNDSDFFSYSVCDRQSTRSWK